MDERPLCLLALDGGGIRGLSELIIIEEIMKRIKFDLGMQDDPVPADFFDLIGGTSTGGLIALLLGRLRLSATKAREEYVPIARDVFSTDRWLKSNKFDAQVLEEAVRKLLRNNFKRATGEERMLELTEPSCKAFVCSVLLKNVRARPGPTLFRTYDVREHATFNCTIWQACRATSAAPTYFDPIPIGYPGEEELFVDGGIGYNNPIEQVVEEARRIFPRRKVACVVSIGTGLARVIRFPESPKTNPLTLINALKSIATDSDATAEKVHGQFQEKKIPYFRFSVDRDLGNIGLNEWEHLSEVRSYTNDYIGQRTISSQIDTVVAALLASRARPGGANDSTTTVQLSDPRSAKADGSRGNPLTLPWRGTAWSSLDFPISVETLANTIIPQSKSAPAPKWIVPFERNKGFVGRESILEKLLCMICPSQSGDYCQRTAIEGLGGTGKTQIAIEAAFRFRKKHPDCSVFWVPAINATSFENAYRDIARVIEVPEIDGGKDDVKALVKDALSSENVGSWLLIIDNADNTDLFGGREFLPSSPSGSILFTTRYHKAALDLLVLPTDIIVVRHMDRNEALSLMKTHLGESDPHTAETTTELLEFLAYLPLAIQQASSYMAKNGTSAVRYLEMCRSSDQETIDLLSEEFDDGYFYENAQKAVATTWWISFKHISKSDKLAADYLQFMCFLADKDIPRALLPARRRPGMRIAAESALGTLKAYAFITEREEPDAYDMHRLVRLAMRKWLFKKRSLAKNVTAVIQRLAKIFPPPSHDNQSTYTRYVPHALAALEAAGVETALNDASHLRLFLKVLGAMMYRVHTEEGARRAFWETFESVNRTLDRKDTPSMDAANRGLFNTMREIDEPLVRQLLWLMIAVLNSVGSGADGSPNTILQDPRSDKEAEQLFRLTLALTTNALGCQSANVLYATLEFARKLWGQQSFRQAEQLLQQVFLLLMDMPDDPSQLLIMDATVMGLVQQGSFRNAERLLRRMVNIRGVGNWIWGAIEFGGFSAIAQGNYTKTESTFQCNVAITGVAPSLIVTPIGTIEGYLRAG